MAAPTERPVRRLMTSMAARKEEKPATSTQQKGNEAAAEPVAAQRSVGRSHDKQQGEADTRGLEIGIIRAPISCSAKRSAGYIQHGHG